MGASQLLAPVACREEVRLWAVKLLAVKENVHLLVVEGDHPRDGQQLAGGEVVRPREVLVHRVTDLDGPGAAGHALVRAQGRGVGADQAREADIRPAQGVPGARTRLEGRNR